MFIEEIPKTTSKPALQKGISYPLRAEAQARIDRRSKEFASASAHVSLERGNTDTFRYSRPNSSERKKPSPRITKVPTVNIVNQKPKLTSHISYIDKVYDEFINLNKNYLDINFKSAGLKPVTKQKSTNLPVSAK